MHNREVQIGLYQISGKNVGEIRNHFDLEIGVLKQNAVSLRVRTYEVVSCS